MKAKSVGPYGRNITVHRDDPKRIRGTNAVYFLEILNSHESIETQKRLFAYVSV